MPERPRLTEDATGKMKLGVTLPGGRYQFSLDDAAVNLLCNDLGLGLGEDVPEPFVPVLVATRDAWFPRQRDTESVVEDFSSVGPLTERERDALIDYVTTVRINPRDEALVKDVVAASPISDAVGLEDLHVKPLPSIPDGIDMGGDPE